MSNLARFLSPYIETIELDNIIGAVVENRLKQGIRLFISHSKNIEILCKDHQFEFSDCEHILSINETSFTYDYCGRDIGDDVLSSPEYDMLLILEDNGYDDVVLAHYKLKDNDLENLVGYFRI
jgi:hypothetical protein